ncbi:potassium voltage-gated channel protein Shaw-like isoform X2 [Mercenaria mercenaria]|uniref:potassium voltage-gated channel protein Shaw-like isoform X2 n=1 Tax=Mercenaria mercenaria TaxID=6596 RepID=UPI00234F21EC|nr:potassium voltage-gated channel protein Shaw-like isoform X2 [Mercenaria mercenaria]
MLTMRNGTNCGKSSKKVHRFISGDGSGGFLRSKKRGKMKGGMSGMVSAMIPGAKVDTKGRVMVNVATSKETLIFNIGGVRFETYKSTLFRLPNSPLANSKFLKEHFRPEKNEYFFDRDPDVFRATLNYLRTGELHIPSYICGPAAKNELEFWGVKPNKIEKCCWTNYNDWNSTLEALNQLEHDRKGSLLTVEVDKNKTKTWWNTHQPKIWNFLNNPDVSFLAKLFGFLSLFFVVLSIFSFVAGTTSSFKNYGITPSVGNFSNEIANEVINATTPDTITGSTESLSESTESTSGNASKFKHPSLHIIDIVCLVFFTAEYIVRLVFAPKKLKFVTSLMGVIDLIAILPDYIEMIVYAADPDINSNSSIVEFITIFRIVRVLRIFRLIKHVPGLWILVYTLKASIGELVLLTCFMSVGILVFSSLIYFVEARADFESIPDAFWWALITMTTVGYGDMYPKTTLGKMVGSICAMSGLLMIGFSVPALVNNFMLYYKHVQFALQAEKEKSATKDEKENTGNSSRSNSSSEEEIVPRKDTFTDDNDNKQECVPLVTIHVEDENGKTLSQSNDDI